MTFSTDVTTDIGKMRLIINDREVAYAIYSDEELQAFLDMAGDVRRAAADALDAMASNQAMVLKVIRLQDLSTDGASVARALREHASRLREQADMADAASGELFDVAEWAEDAFQKRQRAYKQWQRSA